MTLNVAKRRAVDFLVDAAVSQIVVSCAAFPGARRFAFPDVNLGKRDVKIGGFPASFPLSPSKFSDERSLVERSPPSVKFFDATQPFSFLPPSSTLGDVSLPSLKSSTQRGNSPMADKNLFGKLVGTAFQAVGAAANVVGKAASAVGSAANAVGEEIAKNDEQDGEPTSSANENQTRQALTSDVLPPEDASNRSEEPGFFERVAEAAEKLNPFGQDDDLSDEDRAFLELLDLDALDEKDDEPNEQRLGFFNVAQFFKRRNEEETQDPDYEAKKAAAAVPRRANLFRVRDLFIFDTFFTKAKKVYLYKSIKRVVLRSNVLMPPLPLPLRVLNSAIDRSLDWKFAERFGPRLFNLSPRKAAGYGFLVGAIQGLDGSKVPHFQIWIEMKNEDGETLIMTCDDKWISNLALKKFLTAVEKSGARPEIWRTNWFTGKLRKLRARKMSRVRFTLRFSQKIGIFLLIYSLIAAIVDLCLN